MKRTRIKYDISELPQEFRTLVCGAEFFDSRSSPEAKVLYVNKDGGYFIKISSKGNLETEAKMTEYFSRFNLSKPPLAYICADKDYMLTEKISGEDCTHYLDNPSRMVDIIAEKLHALHSIEALSCPIKDRMGAYFNLAEENFKKGVFDNAFITNKYAHLNANEAWNLVEQNRCIFSNNALIHGDYCLPNIILNNWNFSGFIDLGNAGVGDKHVDLFWGAWTLNFNLKTEKYRDRFFDAYGRTEIDFDKIDLISVAESFG